MQENRMYDEMMKAARQRLAGRDAREIARCANVAYTDNTFKFTSLGQEICVSLLEYIITPELEAWHQLVILHYLDLADGTELSGTYISFAEQKSGLVRGGGFDISAEKYIQNSLGKTEPETLRRRCKKLGCTERESRADLCVEIPFLPNYPLMLNMWLADEEFPASGRLQLDANADHYLTVEDSVTVGDIVLRKLAQE